MGGVTQGSGRGPLIFTMFINDIFNNFASPLRPPYADDLKIFRIINDINDKSS